jgi:hypothetical protein
MSRFAALFPVDNPVNPIPRVTAPNLDFEPTNNLPWLRISILDGDGRLFPGNLTALSVGIIAVQVFLPHGSGVKVGNLLADHVSGIFSGKTFNQIFCGFTKKPMHGIVDGWYQINVDTPFRRWENLQE